jgi:predicted transcriptional regulator
MAMTENAAARVNKKDNQRIAMQLRKSGATYEQIGKQLDVSKATAWRYVKEAVAEAREEVRESAQELIEIETQRLDAMLVPMLKRAVEGSEKAVMAVLKIQERRAKYLGLDTPAELNVNVEPKADLEKLSDEELDAFEALMEKAKADEAT